MKTLLAIWVVTFMAVFAVGTYVDHTLTARAAEGKAEIERQNQPVTLLEVDTSKDILPNTYNPQQTINGTELQGGTYNNNQATHTQGEDKR